MKWVSYCYINILALSLMLCECCVKLSASTSLLLILPFCLCIWFTVGSFGWCSKGQVLLLEICFASIDHRPSWYNITWRSWGDCRNWGCLRGSSRACWWISAQESKLLQVGQTNIFVHLISTKFSVHLFKKKKRIAENLDFAQVFICPFVLWNRVLHFILLVLILRKT